MAPRPSALKAKAGNSKGIPIERLWNALQALRVGITIQGLIDASGGAYCASTTRLHLRRWVQAGHVRCVGEGVNGKLPATYELVSAKTSPPPSGKQSGPNTKRIAMWRAIKVLKVFTYREIASAATLGTCVVNPATARWFVKALAQAGYLQSLGNARVGKYGQAQQYRLVRHTGPVPPTISETQVTDCNTGEVFALRPRAAASGEGAGDE